MKIRLEGGLPFVTATLRYEGRELSLEQVLLDTGSGGSVFAADDVSRLGLLAGPQDPIQRIRGVGGTEFVFAKQLDALLLGHLQVDAFKIQVGAMDYGFPSRESWVWTSCFRPEPSSTLKASTSAADPTTVDETGRRASSGVPGGCGCRSAW